MYQAQCAESGRGRGSLSCRDTHLWEVTLCLVVFQTSMSVGHPHQCTVEVQQTARTWKGATTAHAAQDMSLLLGQQYSGMRVRTHVKVRMMLRFLPLILEVSGPKC